MSSTPAGRVAVATSHKVSPLPTGPYSDPPVEADDAGAGVVAGAGVGAGVVVGAGVAAGAAATGGGVGFGVVAGV
ncbi:MAG: hypothetical protein KDI37_13565, partial [Xanthomonadales bacterium]|nr:hypothetical protein [Xanthomonadales bacterium]